MNTEYWATFSIYDHRRKDLFGRALLLFDRVVIPIPTRPMGDLTQEEIDATLADAKYLVDHDAAVLSSWDPQEFFESMPRYENSRFDREEISGEISRYHEIATREWLVQMLDELSLPRPVFLSKTQAVGVPIYSDEDDYQTSSWHSDPLFKLEQETKAHSATLKIVFNKLLVPSRSVSFEKIIRLRNSKKFKDSMLFLRKWQYQVVKELLADPNQRLINAAALDFEIWIKQYNDAIQEANIEKLQTAVTSALVIGATLATGADPLIAILAGLAPTVFSLRKIIEPSWKRLGKEEFAPAGLIYAASKL